MRFTHDTQLFVPPIIIIDRYMFFTRFAARVSYLCKKKIDCIFRLGAGGGGGEGEGLTQKDPVSLGSHANRLSSNLEAEISNYVIAQLSQILYVNTLTIVGISVSSISLYDDMMRTFQKMGVIS